MSEVQVQESPVKSAVVALSQPPVVVTTARKGFRRRWIVLAIGGLAAAAAVIWGWPAFQYSMSHVSTDDAFVNSHITYISPRVTGVAQEVFVDDNQFVEKGTPLIRLDSAGLELAVGQKQAELAKAQQTVAESVAALAVAKADLEQARTDARARFAGLRASWALVETVGDFIRYELASLASSDANIKQQQANEQLAQEEYDRMMKLNPSSVSQDDIDQRKAALQEAHQEVQSAQDSAQQTRALLGLSSGDNDAAVTPADVAQHFNGTQYVMASFQQSLEQLGIDVGDTSHLDTLKARLLSLVGDNVVEHAPAVVAAQARVTQALAVLGGDTFDLAHPERQPVVMEAQKELEEAQLQLSYSNITAPISGYISRRNVNPGTHVTEGQALLAIRPLQDVWIEANFKETQLDELMIGQPVELHVDAYPHHIFKGRIAGFSPGTGAVMSLLPPENATGNYVKIVQRLPVRIELTEPNSPETPLLAGLSVDPEVDINATPIGPDAGKRLLTLNGGQATP